MRALYSSDATAAHRVVQNEVQNAGKWRPLTVANLRLFCTMKMIVKCSPKATQFNAGKENAKNNKGKSSA
jgi:hypothetical protein